MKAELEACLNCGINTNEYFAVVLIFCISIISIFASFYSYSYGGIFGSIFQKVIK